MKWKIIVSLPIVVTWWCLVLYQLPKKPVVLGNFLSKWYRGILESVGLHPGALQIAMYWVIFGFCSAPLWSTTDSNIYIYKALRSSVRQSICDVLIVPWGQTICLFPGGQTLLTQRRGGGGKISHTQEGANIFHTQWGGQWWQWWCWN